MLKANQCKLIGVYNANDCKKLVKKFDSYAQLKEFAQASPYALFCGILNWGFTYADKLIVKKYPAHSDSIERCKYAILDILKTDSNVHGNTKMLAEDMFNELYKLIGDCSKYALECIQTNDFHYNSDTKEIGLVSLYNAEVNIASAIKSRLHYSQKFDCDVEQYRIMDGMKFADEQINILRLARDYPICILSGAAGAGKSATTKALVDMLEDNCQTYQLLAPTGIAAKRLREATGKSASTIHMYLMRSKVPVDYIIIDEFSMVGVELLNMLLNSSTITMKTRLIFVCDEAQLASISPGNIIKNLLDFNEIPIARLTKIFRYGIGGIATIATDIRNGDKIDLRHKWKDARYYQYAQAAAARISTEEYTLMATEFDGAKDVLLLTPKKIGRYGTYRINNMIQAKVSHGNPLPQFDYVIKDRGQEYPISFRIGDKVINIKNNYNALTSDGSCGIIMNGEIGIVTGERIIDEESCLCVQFDDIEIAYSKADIRNLQLAYALTCHKVQGQQAKCVIFLADEDAAFMLTRNLMYVAVSRAQEMIVMIGDDNVIQNGVKKVETNSRKTWLLNLLQEDIK